MFIDASSWKSSFAAYGMCTCAILFWLLHGRHWKSFLISLLKYSSQYALLKMGLNETYAIGVISPQISHMWTRKASDTSNSLSFKNALAP